MEIIFLISLGRSGSTFLAKAISEEADFFNLGEQRPLWERLSRKKTSMAIQYYEDFILKRVCHSHIGVIDKSPNLVKSINIINELSRKHDVSVVYLSRNLSKVASSRDNFRKTFWKFDRIIMRIKKYWRDYRFYLIFILLRELKFLLKGVNTYYQRRISIGSKSTNALVQEKLLLEDNLNELSCDVTFVEINYEKFTQDCKKLNQLGLDEEIVSRIAGRYSPS